MCPPLLTFLSYSWRGVFPCIWHATRHLQDMVLLAQVPPGVKHRERGNGSAYRRRDHNAAQLPHLGQQHLAHGPQGVARSAPCIPVPLHPHRYSLHDEDYKHHRHNDTNRGLIDRKDIETSHHRHTLFIVFHRDIVHDHTLVKG